MTYAIAGVFVEWVDEVFGRDAVHELYGSLDVRGTAAENQERLEQILGLGLDDAQARLRHYVAAN